MASTNVEDEMPQSVEEAGALLGATVIGYGSSSFAVKNPPKGIHSSFATISPVPSSELFSRLHALRSLLRSAPKDTPLVAAPSLLAGVLLKLLGISSSLAANLSSTSGNMDPSKRTDIPPMLSTPIRRVWVHCVVLCHSLGDGLSGNARINLYGFVRDMIMLAGLNPRTARALGGTRVAALEVIGGLLEDSKLSSQLASWAFDIVQLCQKALKSSGNGEPSYRVAAVEAACSVAVASREAFLKTRSIEGSAQLVLKGALEDKAIFEMIKLLKVAVQDKLPEVRSCAARLACLLAPLVINQHVKSPSAPDAPVASPTASLEDVMTIAFKNLDDESVHVSGVWSEALARCMSTSIEYKRQTGNDRSGEDSAAGKHGETSLMARSGRKGVLPASACNTVQKAMKYLVSVFIKVGGESTAPRAGGSFSVGGRAMRVALARCLVQLLRLQQEMQALGDGRALSYKEAVLIILSMVGSDMESQLNPTDRSPLMADHLDATTVVTPGVAAAAAAMTSQPGQPGRNLFGQGPKLSLADACVARLLTARVFREGLSEMLVETTQLTLLHELIHLCRNKQEALKGNQLQVILAEISHLSATLGEGAASSLEELLPALKKCICHLDHGVRHEAAVLHAALSSIFPSEGRKIIREMINSIQLEHAELMSVASSPGEASLVDSYAGASRFRFGRNAPTKEIKFDASLKHQCAIHGMGLSASLILRELPNLPGGLPLDILDAVMSVSEILVSTLSNSVMKDGSPSGTCTCVRAGFGLISGTLTTGPHAITQQIALIFSLWRNVANTDHRSKKFTTDHEMMCLEALLTSLVAFLKHCSELLLSIPDALSRTSLILENVLPMFFGKGRFGSKPANPIAAARLESAMASLLEAFAWLPPGSYPMVADSVFGFAAFHIQSAIQNDVICSVLPSLVSKEDEILDAVSFSRATRLGEVGGAKDLESDIIAISCEASYPGDRESAFSFLVKRRAIRHQDKSRLFLGSEVLGLYACQKCPMPPTVLHEVGTWRTPVDPSCNTKVRLVDAAIQAFASTFGLKSGKEQQKAMDILQSLLPPVYFQVGRSLVTADQERSGKSKDNLASTANIAAVLLSCVKALPMDESTHDIPVGLGPTWMNKASDLLLGLLPSSHNEVRRAAAEGLAFLATLGVKEDMHFLQSSVLHSLDEIISASPSQGQGRNIVQDDIQAGRSGGLLTLACMQRNSYQIRERRVAKSRLRGSPGGSTDESQDSLPIIQVMIRLLPYISGNSSPGISLSARTFALHAHLLLLEYSKVFKQTSLSNEDVHLLKKSVEIVEDNFLSAWTMASQMLDQGSDGGKIAFEASFVAVLLRLMTFLTPFLHHLDEHTSEIARRFSMMGIVIEECLGFHPVVQCESMAFFEVLARHRSLLPPHSGGIKYDEHPVLCVIPFMMDNITSEQTLALPCGIWAAPRGCRSSKLCVRATFKVMRAMALSKIFVAEWSDMKAISLLFSAIESTVGTAHYSGEIFYRGVSAPRAAETVYNGDDATNNEIVDTLRFLLYLERESTKNTEAILLRFVLLARSLASGPSGPRTEDDEEVHGGSNTVRGVTIDASRRAFLDCQPVFDFANPIRWQTKSLAIQIANVAMHELARKWQQTGGMSLLESPNFNPCVAALELLKVRQAGGAASSFLSFHISEIVTASCVAAIATVDQVELRILQENAMHMLATIIDFFGASSDPSEANTSVLNEYVPQISSCIKSALAAQYDEFNEMTCRLFWVGCDTLRCFLKAKITNDKGVLKRIIRPVVLSKEESIFFEIDTKMPVVDDENEDSNMRSSLLVKIGKVWTLGRISIDEPDVLAMLGAGFDCLGAHSAALAADGATLLLSNNMTLVGHPMKELTTHDPAGIKAGFYSFGDVTEIDDYVKAALVKAWASCAESAVNFLGKVIVSSDTPATVSEACVKWMKVVVPLAFAGLNDSMKAGSYDDSLAWAKEIDSDDVACCCLSAICKLAESEELLKLEEAWGTEIEALLIRLYERVIAPILSSRSPRSSSAGIIRLVGTASSLLTVVAVLSSSSNDDFESSRFLLTILGPLDLLQKGDIDLSNELAKTVVASCMTSTAKIIENGAVSAGLVKAMISLVMSLSSREEKVPEVVRVSSQQLLKQCVAHESVTISQQSGICVKLATVRDWGTWSVLVKEKDGTIAEKSLIEFEKALLNPSYTGEQLTALSAIRSLIQSSPIPSIFVGRLVSALGAEILSVFQAYGTLTNKSSEIQSQRFNACADCMKVALAAYQQFSADCSEEKVSQFLAVLFEVFIAIIRFNGLPNHPAPQGALSDASIGRMCAQAITHVARTTPVPFKVCMNDLSKHDRAVLEFAVRGEMSGYAAAAPAPAKKKLNLKGFTK